MPIYSFILFVTRTDAGDSMPHSTMPTSVQVWDFASQLNATWIEIVVDSVLSRIPVSARSVE